MTVVFNHNKRFIARIDDGSFLLKYKGDDSSFCSPYKAVLYPGVYLIECWGAESGEIIPDYSGKGGFSSGVLTLKRKIKAYFHIGGKGQYRIGEAAKGGNNGGADGLYSTDMSDVKCLFYASGGGASDVRLLKDNLLNRVIVAGGGGSNGYMEDLDGSIYYGKGGSGGGFEGEDGKEHKSGSIGQGGKADRIAEKQFPSSFGRGGIRGGGGGWYGGAGSYSGNGNGGGSGFVFNSKQYIPNNYQLTEEFMLSNTSLITGNTGIISPTGRDEIGHHGNGAIRITILDRFGFNGCICFTKKLEFRRISACIYITIAYLTH